MDYVVGFNFCCDNEGPDVRDIQAAGLTDRIAFLAFPVFVV
jgi:hypothetical protein